MKNWMMQISGVETCSMGKVIVFTENWNYCKKYNYKKYCMDYTMI